MRAQAFNIASRHREHPNQVPAAADFELVAAGDADARAVVDDPFCSFYCVDAKHGRALFVETPRDVDLHHQAFLYQAQYRNATRVFALSYDGFIEAGRARVEHGENVVFVYSVGRCGSTLLSRAFHRFDDVLSLSEPTVPRQLLKAPADPMAAALLESTVRLLCKPDGRKRPSHYVIKLRAEETKLATALHRMFPSSRAMFLYRNAVDVARSFLHAFHPLPAAVRGYHEDPVGFFARFWLSNVSDFQAAHESGVPIRAFRYEDLVREPREVFSEIVRWCATPLVGLDKGCAAFAEDSQEGSNLARQSLNEKPSFDFGSPEQFTARVRAALADHPTLHDPDSILPGTWMPGQPSTPQE